MKGCVVRAGTATGIAQRAEARLDSILDCERDRFTRGESAGIIGCFERDDDVVVAVTTRLELGRGARIRRAYPDGPCGRAAEASGRDEARIAGVEAPERDELTRAAQFRRCRLIRRAL